MKALATVLIAGEYPWTCGLDYARVANNGSVLAADEQRGVRPGRDLSR